MVHLGFREATLEECASIDAGGGVTLKIHLVPLVPRIFPPEEMVEADLVQACRGRIGRDVPPDAVIVLVGPRHHDYGVPADHPANAFLDLFVARKRRLLLRRDGVNVRRLHQFRYPDMQHARTFQHAPDQELRPSLAVQPDHVVQGIDPFLRLRRIRVRQLLLEVRDQVFLHQIIPFYGICTPLQDLSPPPVTCAESNLRTLLKHCAGDPI